MLWGAISYAFKGPLIRLNLGEDMQGRRKAGGLNGERYVKQVLEGPLVGFVRELEEEYGSSVYVVEDGAPAHRSRVAREARTRLGIKLLPHPPNSPDISPIENAWFLLKSRISRIPGSYSSLDNLWAAARRVWDELTIEDIQKYTKLMSERVAAVRSAHGMHTRY
jgi:transposase